MNEETCKDCIHFDACSKWTDFPKQCGVPVCARFNEQSEGEWISVKDGFPPIDLECLVVVKRDGQNHISVGKLITYNYQKVNGEFIPVSAWRVIDYEEQDDEYTHWMPLPKLPKMKGGE